MKIVKPLKLSVLHRTFQNAGQPVLAVTAMAFFPFGAPKKLLAEVPMWISAMDALGSETPLDNAMPKSRGELLVAGNACVLGGKPGPATNVVVEMATSTGSIKKELYVIGDRQWERSGPGAPAPFTVMPVTWSRAFGGPDFKANHLGKGHAPIEVDGRKLHPLPNVEDRRALVKSPDDTPAPVGLGPMDQMWPVRAQHVGTYDDRWLKTRFPWFPDDFHWEFFNVAPEDQRIEGFFVGGERFRVEGMHPEKRVVEGEVPRLLARLFVRRKGEVELTPMPPARLDTVLLLPNIERGIAIYRSTINVGEDDAHDIGDLVAAFDDPAAPRPLSHFAAVVAKREDKRLAALNLLLDEDLLPPEEGTAAPEDDWNDLMKLHEPKMYALNRMLKKLDGHREELREELRSRGLDPKLADENVPEVKLPPREPAALAQYLQEQLDNIPAQQEMIETKKKEALDKARAAVEARGLDFDEVLADSKKQGGGPPKLRAKEQLERLADRRQLGKNAGFDVSEIEAQLNDPKFVASLHEGERQAVAAYRAFAHFFPEAPPLDSEAAAAKRALAMTAVGGGSLAGCDLTCADLSGLDLTGVDLSEALMEGVNLTGAKLDRASLRGACLARAVLRDASLVSADLEAANLGKAELSGARFEKASLKSVTFHETDASSCSFAGADLTKLSTLSSKFEGSSFAGANLDSGLFYEQSFHGADFVRANLTQAVFFKCDLVGCDFGSAKLERTGFIDGPVDDAKFVSATLDRTVFALGASLARADLRGARMKHVSLRGCPMAGADLSGAVANDCDFSEADLTGAKMFRIEAERSLFVRTVLRGVDLKSSKLMYGVLDKAEIHGADLRSANLFRASLAKVRGDKATRLESAYLVQILVVPEPNNPEKVV